MLLTVNYYKSMNACLIPTIRVSFDAVSYSGSSELPGLLLFSHLTKLCVKNTITQVSHPQFPTEQHATCCILTNIYWIATGKISINAPLHHQLTWLIGLLLFPSLINLHQRITNTQSTK